jgi:hypothetical protein
LHGLLPNLHPLPSFSPALSISLSPPPPPPLPAVDDDAGYTAEPAAKEDEGEPQYNALREFNEQWRLQLDQKAQLAREEQEVLRTAAAEDIKKMYVENESNREQRQAANRQSEQKFLEDMESQLEVASENPWQRVTSLVRSKRQTTPFGPYCFQTAGPRSLIGV